jgi:hypothetical protein
MALQKAMTSFQAGNVSDAINEFSQLIEQSKGEKSNALAHLYAYV